MVLLNRMFTKHVFEREYVIKPELPFILAQFHQEQEEISKDWTVQDVDKRKGGRVIRAGVAIKLKGRKPKPEGEGVYVLRWKSCQVI